MGSARSRSTSCGATPAFPGCHEGGGRERCSRNRRHRRLHQRCPPPRRDRTRVRHRLHDRRLRPDLRRNADRCGHEALGSLPRHGRVPGGRRRSGRAGVAQAARSSMRASRSVDGRTLTEVAESVEETSGQTVVVPIETPLKSRGGIAILRGNLAPDGMRGQARRPRPHGTPWTSACVRLGGGVLRGGEGGCDPARRRGRDPLRRPGRGAGDARDAARHGRDRRRGPLGVGRPRDRRALLRRDPRVHGRTCGAGGVPRRAARRTGRRRHGDVDVEARELRVELSDDELTARLADWTAPAPRHTDGVFAKYAALVSSASEGAVTRPS